MENEKLILSAFISMIFGYFGACFKIWHENNIKAKDIVLEKVYIPYIQMLNSFNIDNNNCYASLSKRQKHVLFKLLSKNSVYLNGNLQTLVEDFLFHYNNPSTQNQIVMNDLYNQITDNIFSKHQKSIIKYYPILKRIPSKFSYYKKTLKFKLDKLLGKGR